VLRNARLIYFSVPKITVARLPELKGPALSVLLSLVKHAGELHQSEFEINVQRWREMSGVGHNKTLLVACIKFEEIVEVNYRSSGHHATIRLLNPETGREISDEQFENTLITERVRRESPYTRAEREAWFRNQFPDAITNGSDLIIHCPRCREIRPNKVRPTLRYDAGKGFWGVFYCDECRFGKRSTPVHLLAEIKGITDRQAERQIEQFMEQNRSKNQ
jgi:hypothetical protein